MNDILKLRGEVKIDHFKNGLFSESQIISNTITYASAWRVLNALFTGLAIGDTITQMAFGSGGDSIPTDPATTTSLFNPVAVSGFNVGEITISPLVWSPTISTIPMISFRKDLGSEDLNSVTLSELGLLWSDLTLFSRVNIPQGVRKTNTLALSITWIIYLETLS